MSEQPIEQAALQSALNLMAGSAEGGRTMRQGFDLALNLQLHEPAFMAEMAPALVLPLPSGRGAAFGMKTFIEIALRPTQTEPTHD